MKINNVKENVIWIKKVVVWITLLFMPLSIYATFIDGVTCGDVLLILGTFIVISYIIASKTKLKKVITLDLIFYIMFILLHSLIIWLFKTENIDFKVLGICRYLLYIFWVSITAKGFFDMKYAYKVYKLLAIIFGTYCIIQFVGFYVFKKFLPIGVLGLPLVEELADKYTVGKWGYYLNGTNIYRPYSVFLEPSYFSAYQIPILYILLNGNRENMEKNILSSIYITISIIMCISTTGLLLLFICWMKPICNTIKKNYNKIIIVFIFFIIILTLVFLNSNFFEILVGRIINKDGTIGDSVIGRIGNMHMLYDGTLSFKEIVFGKGMTIDTDYLPSYGRIIISFGIIGLIYIISMLLYAHSKANTIGKAMVKLILIMFLGTNTLFNITSVLMLTLIYSNMTKYKGEEDANL